jgi:hypothetical protein
MRVASAVLLCLSTFASTFSVPSLAAEPGRVKVLVLDIKSTDFSVGEVETLTSLVTAHLARYPELDVMSGADIKRLVDLEAQKQSAGCDQGACLAEIAGAMGAQLVFFGQAGKLGSTVVLTLNVFDALKNQAVGRQPVDARDLSQLPQLIGPAIDRMVGPLFESLRVSGGGVGPAGHESLRASPVLGLGSRARELYDAQAMDVCVDDEKRTDWWFCERDKRVTENKFIRRYRDVTGQRDLDEALVNRNRDGAGVPIGMIAGGSALVVAALPILYFTYGAPVAALQIPVDDTGQAPLGGVLGLGTGAVGLGLGIYGGILLGNALKFTDGEVTDHTLSEANAREAVVRYNNALVEKVQRDLGASP